MTPAEFFFMFVAVAFVDAIAYFEFVKSREELGKLEQREAAAKKAPQHTALETGARENLEKELRQELNRLLGEIVLLRSRLNSHEFESMGIKNELERISEEIQALKSTNISQISRIAVEIELMKEKMGEEAKAFETG